MERFGLQGGWNKIKKQTLKNVLDCMRIDDLGVSEEVFEKIKEPILYLMENLWDE